MKEFYDFLGKMGGMHDSVVTCLAWLPSEKKLEIHVEDIFSNFEGFPKYPGPQSGTIVLHGVLDLNITVNTGDPLWVFDFFPDENESDVVVITFSPTGKIRARFSSADYPTPPW